MMIVVANLRLSGFFRLVNGWAVTRARATRCVLLVGRRPVAGVLSAFLVNDAICLVLTPLVLDLVARLERDPVPYLLAVAMASNVGSVATITGNPQNMIIGILSQHPLRELRRRAGAGGRGRPAARPSLLIALALSARVPRPASRFAAECAAPARIHRAAGHQGGRSSTLAMMALFFAGQPVGQGRDRRRRAPAAHAPGQAGEGLPRDRLAAAPDVRRPVRRRRRLREGGARRRTLVAAVGGLRPRARAGR